MLARSIGLAGDRAFEDVVGLVAGVKRQLEVEAVRDMNVRICPLFALLEDPLALDLVDDPLGIQGRRDRLEAVGEQVQVDVRAPAHVAGQRAADQARAETLQKPHHAQGFQAHLPQLLGAVVALVHPGHDLDFVADFAIAGQVGGLEVAADDSPGGLHLGPEILRFFAGVHEPGRFPCEPATRLVTSHRLCADIKPIDAARGIHLVVYGATQPVCKAQSQK